ncbi:uncharacterized protein LOC125573153 [Nematostella vectensis]|uniref:uncharacterized protein LOC125573153 n=1 Tax=Nematostella vectensis TaxID=45351 RepID=UPI00207700D9|nr:uncharacterized protein LOC125573153 [Nematostella vectensis]
MRLQYKYADSKSEPHQFYVKSQWQPPPQPSVALETFLELTKSELANLSFEAQSDNITTGERQALNDLKNNRDIIIKKADKGTTTVICDTSTKIKEGTEQLLDEKFYQPLSKPIVEETAKKVQRIVDSLRTGGFIDKMTYKWLNDGQKPIRIPEFYTLTKIHKKVPIGRPIVSGSRGPTERISSFVDSLLQPIEQKQKSYLKDTTHFINFIESTVIPDSAFLTSFDVCALYTNIPQDEGIEVVCQQYEQHYNPVLPVPTESLRELMGLILKENSFKFNDKHYLQTHGIAMGTKMAVAFSVIYTAHIEEELLRLSPYKPLVWKRFIDDIFAVWTIPGDKIASFLNFANVFHPTIKFTHELSQETITFLDTEVFKGERFMDSNILDVRTHFKPTETFQYTHFSSCHPLSNKKGFVKGEGLRLLRTNSSLASFKTEIRNFTDRLLERGYPSDFITTILASVKFTDSLLQKGEITQRLVSQS